MSRYGLAPTPLLATIYYGLIDAFFTAHTSGAWVNYLEVGAEVQLLGVSPSLVLIPINVMRSRAARALRINV